MLFEKQIKPVNRLDRFSGIIAFGIYCSDIAKSALRTTIYILAK